MTTAPARQIKDVTALPDQWGEPANPGRWGGDALMLGIRRSAIG